MEEVWQVIGTHNFAAWRAVRQRIGAEPPHQVKDIVVAPAEPIFLLPRAAILFSGGLEGPAWQDWELRHWAAAKTRLEQRPMTEGPRRYAS